MPKKEAPRGPKSGAADRAPQKVVAEPVDLDSKGDGKGGSRPIPPLALVRRRSGAHLGDMSAEEVKTNPHYSDEVQLRLINLIYDPLATLLFQNAGIDSDEAHLLSLTRINSSREAWHWSVQFGKEAAYNRYVQKNACRWPISKVMRIAFLLARRSIPGQMGPGFALGVGLAQEQAITKTEEVEEEKW